MATLAASSLLQNGVRASGVGPAFDTMLAPKNLPHGGRRLLDTAAAWAPMPSVQAPKKAAAPETCDSGWSHDVAQQPSRFAPQTAVDSRLPTDRAVYNFETSLQGWEPTSQNDTVSMVQGTAYDGAHALALGVHAVAAEGDHGVQVLGPETVPANATISMQVWFPADAPVHWAGLFVKDGDNYRYTSSGVSADQLHAERWNTLTVVAPDDANFTQSIGLDLTLDGPWCGQVLVDAVGWQGAPTRDGSQSTAFMRTVATPQGPAPGTLGRAHAVVGI